MATNAAAPPNGTTPLTTALAAMRGEVTQEIRRQIIEGELRPGERLVERSVAERLGVSRSPVREALQVLIFEGFLVAETPRKVAVRRWSRRDVENLFEVREALEPAVTALAARRATSEDVGRLTRLLDETHSATDETVLHRLSADFHDVVTEIAANEQLHLLMQTIQGRMRWLMQQNEDWSRLMEEHAILVQLIATHSEAAAREFALAHVKHSCALALASLFPCD
ncbi:GntR family transcriptional regulator [Mycobacterium sp. 21AC1]|uniref:GntR family transcriptional regulator n=1 Tax=[Mycobacterium] appelbergii TaxID=2939269 RepID=UPI0029390486|nr:GntR family transcriptional regulator [Mycobacterium sp. 21AC1]MDV3128386.1 GntR family transcriptional regulator [Mycobacterium sp. 21AC1]